MCTKEWKLFVNKQKKQTASFALKAVHFTHHMEYCSSYTGLYHTVAVSTKTVPFKVLNFEQRQWKNKQREYVAVVSGEVYWNVFAEKKTHSGFWLVLSYVPRFSFSKTVITSPELPVCSSTDFLRTKWITMLWCTSPGGSRSATSHPVSPPSWTASANPCTTTILTPARRLRNRLLWYAHFDLWPCDQHCFASSYSFIFDFKDL